MIPPFKPHPMVPIPAEAEIDALIRRVGIDRAAVMLAEYEATRLERIRKSIEDPFHHGFVIEPSWRDADRLLSEGAGLLCIFGGNRAGKTEYCVRKAVQTLVNGFDKRVLILHEAEPTSIELHHKGVYKYLPNEWRGLKRSQTANIKYDDKNGFSNNKFTTPNGGVCMFGCYYQDPRIYEGLAFDLIIGDENMPLRWLEGLKRGLADRNGKFLWPYTAIDGMTPAIKDVTSGAVTMQSLPVDPAVLSPEEIHVEDCPPGHMPYIQKGAGSNNWIIYFHSKLNPFCNYTRLVEDYGHKEKVVRERRFYGYARNTIRTTFPKFGAHNIIDERLVPQKDVSRYLILDPAGARNFFLIWVAVDNAGRHFVYREWPDMPRHGEWALPSEDSRKWDGAPGPAQPALGHGVKEYKRLILEEEGNRWTGTAWDEKGEWIDTRYIDPRSGSAQSVAEDSGGTSLIDRFADEQTDAKGVVDGPALYFLPAPGLREEEGLGAINSLLDFDRTAPITALVNEPKLYVSRRCANVIWAMQNYTQHDGEKAACKDPIDCLRYMATADLQHTPADQLKGFGSRGSY